ncbi:MAG: hypothetical protein IT324_14115 [Anaerolineae bacterium]|nr:hypothetical protein [Anaerolineae bacterium]
MQEIQAVIERVRRVSATIQRLEIAVDRSHRGILNVEAGQLFLVRATESLDPYLREPWTPVRREKSRLIIERPVSQTCTPGQVVSLMGPVGKPIPLRDTGRTLLLIAYEATPASLLLLAETALGKGVSVAMVLIGAALHYPLEALPEEMEIVRGTDDGKWASQADTFKWADQIVAVASPPFDMPYYGKLLASLRDIRVEVPTGHVYGLFQPPMPCGIGACQACLIRSGSQEVAACLEGPAFDLLTLKALPTG